MNPYTELDVPVNASLEDIKQRYRTLAQMHHPDKGGDEELFKRIKLAYEILSDPVRRKQYDITGETTTTNAKDEAVANIVQILLHVVPNFNADQDDLIKIAEDEARAAPPPKTQAFMLLPLAPSSSLIVLKCWLVLFVQCLDLSIARRYEAQNPLFRIYHVSNAGIYLHFIRHACIYLHFTW